MLAGERRFYLFVLFLLGNFALQCMWSECILLEIFKESGS